MITHSFSQFLIQSFVSAAFSSPGAGRRTRMPSSSSLPGVMSRRSTMLSLPRTSRYFRSWSESTAVSGTTTASYLSLTGTRTRTREPGMSRAVGVLGDAADQDRAGARGVLVVGEHKLALVRKPFFGVEAEREAGSSARAAALARPCPAWPQPASW